jgi:hypothetical protein
MVTLEQCAKAGGRFKDGLCDFVAKEQVKPLRVILNLLMIFGFVIILFVLFNPLYLDALVSPFAGTTEHSVAIIVQKSSNQGILGGALNFIADLTCAGSLSAVIRSDVEPISLPKEDLGVNVVGIPIAPTTLSWKIQILNSQLETVQNFEDSKDFSCYGGIQFSHLYDFYIVPGTYTIKSWVYWSSDKSKYQSQQTAVNWS